MSQAYACAVRLLARREHGAYELAQKLAQKGYAEAEANAAICECQRLGLQSDMRFAESLCRTRVRQGYGPLRIQMELQNRQIAVELIDDALQDASVDWFNHAIAVKNKKFSNACDLSFEAMQKQKQFLYYRGFPSDVIKRIFKPIKLQET